MKEVSSTQLFAGMNTDIDPKFQTEGYRFALNSTLRSADGNYLTNNNELGNVVNATLPDGLVIIGTCLTDNDDIIIFSTDETTSEIGYFNPNKESYQTLIRSSCLNFSTKYPVFSIFSIKRGCDRTIYFTDRFNKYRTINLSHLKQYTTEDSAQDANLNDNWECELFNLTPDYQVPIIDLLSVNNTGGNLKVGTYQFAIQYVDIDGNTSNWFYVTNPVPIVDEPLTSDYFEIDGAIPVLNLAEPEEGSVPTTNKSITLQINNLDTNYPNFKIAALHSTATIGRVSEVWIGEITQITNDTQTYTYGGPNLDVDVRGSLADIIIDDEPIHVVKAHAEIDQSLWLGNLERKQYNYADFQRSASKISTLLATKRVKAPDILQEGDPKNPFTWWQARSFMADEVYAFGIQYLFKDSSWSPVFHIPGRVGLNFDKEILLASDQSSHLGEGDFPRWRVHNTSTGSNTERGFSYHETLESTYPNITDCNGENIWGVDINNNSLVGTPIRHHKFPDRRAVPIYNNDDNTIVLLGAKFTNIQYPSSDIVGHRFLMAERNDDNKTILDNGLLVNPDTVTTAEKTMYFGSTSGLGNNHKTLVYISPKTLVEKRYFNADHFRCHSAMWQGEFTVSEGEVNDPGANADMKVYVADFGKANYLPPANQNIKLNNSIYINPRTAQTNVNTFSFPLVNESFSNPAYFFSYEPDINYERERIIASAKRTIDPYRNLSGLTYMPIHNGYVKDEEDFEAFGGDSFVTRLNYFDNYRVKIQGDTPGILFFVSPIYAILKSLEDEQIQFALADFIKGVWLDSEINYALRHGGTQDCNQILHENKEPWKHLRDKLYNVEPDSINPITGDKRKNAKYEQKLTPCEEYYAYNMDYSKTQKEKGGQALLYAFNYCSECLNSYPNRIRVSQRSYQEERRDNYRVFRAGDRNDLPGRSGAINALAIHRENLYALCNRDTYFIPINAQTLQTSETLMYLGTGERLSIPPRRLSNTDYPYSGCVHKQSVLQTEVGLFYIDYLSKRVLLMSEQGQYIREAGVVDLSDKGMKTFFQNNMEFELDRQFKKNLGRPYPFLDNTTYQFGLGFTAAYDPYFRRIILSKKDYSLTDLGVKLLTAPTTAANLVWKDDSFQLGGNSIRPQKVKFSDKLYFKNNSWTLSFSVPEQAWASYHSYMPSLMFNDAYSFYSIENSNLRNIIWKHNEEDYQTFYDQKYPYIIDLVQSNNPTVASTYTVFDVNCNASLGGDTDNFFFDKAIIYNSYQSSGELPISIRTNSFAPALSDSLIATRAERNWRLSDFRDNIIDYNQPLFSNSWQNISDNYYIDKVVNPDVISSNKNPFEQGRFRDHYVGCRLFFQPEENVKMTTHLVSSVNKISFR
jgi:hypothetical protein